MFFTGTLKVCLQCRPRDTQKGSAGAWTQFLPILRQGCGSQQMQLPAGTRGGHIQQSLRLIIFPPAL